MNNADARKIVDPLFVECESAQAKFVGIGRDILPTPSGSVSGQGPCDHGEMVVRDARQVIEDTALDFQPPFAGEGNVLLV
ncbi:hypothetical protein ABIC08_008635 [Bradyrhizobium sp. RT9b]|uniref:hypothetical protein n=1 Tax=unclassified Bradyrhizobium TaxID=2631580 RepID=UPI0033967810